MSFTPQYTPNNIPVKSQWLGGVGAGSWFYIAQQDTLFKINRFSKDGALECTGLFSIDKLGLDLSKKYKKLYEVTNHNMPNDIQVLINNNESGIVLLRLVEVIGQDRLKDIGSETLYFIISALNQLNMDPLRNKILLKILPLKV